MVKSVIEIATEGMEQEEPVKTLTFEQSAEIDRTFASAYEPVVNEFNRKHANSRAYVNYMESISVEM